MTTAPRVIDVWMQHPTAEFLAHPMFASLRRWTRSQAMPTELPLETTLQSMDAAGVRLGLLSAWWGPDGPLIPNEAVAAVVERAPGRPIPYLDQVALEFPELVVVGGHIGYPWTDEMVSLATKYENVYIDSSAYVPRRYPRPLVDFTHGNAARVFGLDAS